MAEAVSLLTWTLSAIANVTTTAYSAVVLEDFLTNDYIFRKQRVLHGGGFHPWVEPQAAFPRAYATRYPAKHRIWIHSAQNRCRPGLVERSVRIAADKGAGSTHGP